jgi:hypothetical protein
MKREEFDELCKVSKPIKVYGTHEIIILFDNGISVEIDTETEYDHTYLTFKTNIEEQLERERWEKENEQRHIRRKEQDEIISKYSPEQIKELQEVFNLTRK